MAFNVQMPLLGENVTEGTVTRWLKQVGDEVELDEPLLEVSTDKVDTEVQSPVAGTLSSIHVQEDETVAVGARLAVIESSSNNGDAQLSELAPSEATSASMPLPDAGWYRCLGTPRSFRYWNGQAWSNDSWTRSRTVFVSYARVDDEAVSQIVEDLDAFRMQVWRDQQLEGGEVWWDEILQYGSRTS